MVFTKSLRDILMLTTNQVHTFDADTMDGYIMSLKVEVNWEKYLEETYRFTHDQIRNVAWLVDNLFFFPCIASCVLVAHLQRS